MPRKTVRELLESGDPYFETGGAAPVFQGSREEYYSAVDAALHDMGYAGFDASMDAYSDSYASQDDPLLWNKTEAVLERVLGFLDRGLPPEAAALAVVRTWPEIFRKDLRR